MHLYSADLEAADDHVISMFTSITFEIRHDAVSAVRTLEYDIDYGDGIGRQPVAAPTGITHVFSTPGLQVVTGYMTATDTLQVVTRKYTLLNFCSTEVDNLKPYINFHNTMKLTNHDSTGFILLFLLGDEFFLIILR